MAEILKRVLVVVALATLAACAGSPPPPAEPAGLAIVGAQLIDGTGGDPIPDSVIVIRDGRVVAAGPRESTEIPEGAEVVDATGQTVIPGLVDMHGHYGGDVAEAEAMMRTQLYYGVTSARSIGTDDADQVALMLEANAGRPDTPRMFTAGRGFTHPGGFNAGAQQPTSEEEAREMVRALAGQGVHFVKMWVNEMPEPGLKITPEIRTAVVEEAIANGLVPVAHIDEEADGRQLVEAGLSDFLHSTVLTFGPGNGAPVDDPEPSAEFIRMCLDNNVSFTPTLSIIQNNWHFAENPELLDDPDLRAAMNPQALERWSDPEVRAEVVEAENFEGRKAAFRQVQDFVKTLHDAGVRIALGTDSGTANVPMGWGTHHELELYVEAGLTPMQAIVAATATSASVAPPVGEAEFGTLEAGMMADLVLLDADPLADIRNTLRIDRVMKSGEWVEREGLLPGEVQHGVTPLVLQWEAADWGPPTDRPGFPSGLRNAPIATDPETGGPTYLGRFPAGSEFAMHWHTHTETVVILEGAVDIVMDGTRHTATVGSYVIIPGGVHHAWYVHADADAVLLARRDGPADFHFAEP